MLPVMRCPNCGIEVPTGAADCASCGVIFAKFKKKLEAAPAPAPSTYNPWKGRVIAAALAVVWFIGFGLYYYRVIVGIRARSPHGTMSRRSSPVSNPPDAHENP